MHLWILDCSSVTRPHIVFSKMYVYLFTSLWYIFIFLLALAFNIFDNSGDLQCMGHAIWVSRSRSVYQVLPQFGWVPERERPLAGCWMVRKRGTELP